jgi:hypothetical protein
LCKDVDIELEDIVFPDLLWWMGVILFSI